MAGGISIKATMVKPERRSRGRVATSTRTIVRGVDEGTHPSQIMSLMAELFPMLEHLPVSYQVRGVRYELLRVEARTVDGVRVKRAIFKGERAVRKAFAREMRRRHRAWRRPHVRAARAEARRRRARADALFAISHAARHTRPTAPRPFAREPLPVLAAHRPLAPAPRLISAIPPS